jgi:glycosyltransferase involved in cell wall biosynthesis
LVGEALAAQYAASDVLLLPSRSETYGMVINESLARAVPVIASDVGGVAEALGAIDGHRAGLLVAERDTQAFADAVRRWLVDAGLRNDLREAAAERRRSLPTWEQTRDVFAQVVAGVAVAR